MANSVFDGMVTAQIVDWQPFANGDNALLRVADLEGTVPLPLAEGTPVVGEDVTAIGFAGSVSEVSDVSRQMPSHKSGTVSSRQYTDQGVPNTEIDAAVTPGMSGGPTLNDEGQVIGVNSFGITNESQPFNFVTDTDTLRDFLQRNGVAPTAVSGTEGNQSNDGTEAVVQVSADDASITPRLPAASALGWILVALAVAALAAVGSCLRSGRDARPTAGLTDSMRS